MMQYHPDQQKLAAADAELIARLLDFAHAGGVTKLRDAAESLRRLPDVKNAFRVTCLCQLEKALATLDGEP